jgi:peptide/nickel transport system permease protein
LNPALGRGLARTLRAVIVCSAVYVVVFLVLSVLPGDPISNRLNSPDSTYTPEEVAEVTAYFGLDEPWWVRLGSSVGNALHGDWGISLSTLQPVTSVVGDAAPTTVALAIMALVAGILISLLVTCGALYSPAAWLQQAFRAVPALGVSVPVFVVGLLLLHFFAFQLGWFNIVRDEGLKALVLPALTIGVPISAPISQLMIGTVDRIRRTDYAKLAQSKGLSTFSITLNHYLRPAAPPVLTLIGLTFGELLAGTVISESIFGLTGIGHLLEQAVLSQDVPVLQLVTFASAAIYVGINLALDLTHPLLDPTVRKASAYA